MKINGKQVTTQGPVRIGANEGRRGDGDTEGSLLANDGAVDGGVRDTHHVRCHRRRSSRSPGSLSSRGSRGSRTNCADANLECLKSDLYALIL